MVKYFIRFFSIATCVFTQLRTFDLTMRSISSESFLFLFTLKLFVLMGNAYPVIDNEEIVKNNSIMKKSENIPIEDAIASVTPYTCVYIPSNLDSCKFNR